jgi:hypothetical protein
MRENETWGGLRAISPGPLTTASLAVVAGAVVGFVIGTLLSTVLGRLAPRHAASIRTRLRVPCALALPLLAVKVIDPAAAWAGSPGFTGHMDGLAARGQHIALIIAISWLLLRLISVAEILLVDRLTTTDAGAPASRKARTQIALLRKFLGTLIGIVAVALILMSFTAIRNLGTSLLASAGAAGIIFGIAAQRSIGNVVAGFQILFTQPLRALFMKIVTANPLWDHAAASLQVTDASESGMQLRCLVSAADAGKLWNLRCEVR